jgi:hypothetical protein
MQSPPINNMGTVMKIMPVEALKGLVVLSPETATEIENAYWEARRTWIYFPHRYTLARAWYIGLCRRAGIQPEETRR